MDQKPLPHCLQHIVLVFTVSFWGAVWFGNASGTPALTWQNLSPLIAPPKMNDVIYSKNAQKFIAVGDSGVILWSKDGITWSGQIYSTSNSKPCLLSVAEADSGASVVNKMVAVGQDGTIVASSNGETWTPSTKIPEVLRSVAWTKNGYFAVGDRGLAARSSTGVAWTEVRIPSAMNLQSVSARGDTIAIAGEADSVFLSNDGVNWIKHPVPAAIRANCDRFAIAFGNKTIILSAGTKDGFNYVFSSTDGNTWEQKPFGKIMSKPAWNGETFIVADKGSTAIDIGVEIRFSVDGITWTSVGTTSTMEIAALAWKGPEWVGVGRLLVPSIVLESYYSMIGYSSDQNGFNYCNGFPNDQFQALLSDSNSVFAFGMFNTFRFSLSPYFSFRSTLMATPSPPWKVPAIDCIKVGDRYVKVGSIWNWKKIEISKDGFSWVSQDIGNHSYRSITWGGKIIVVGDSGSIRISSDATLWDTVSSPTTNTLNRITYDADKYVAIGDSGTILTSRDGTEWTIQKSGTTESLNGILWAENRFLVVGTNGTILSSDDAQNWNLEKSGSTKRLNSIAWGAGVYLAVGDSGTIITSSDTMDWSPSNAGTIFDLNDVVFHNGRFIIAGSGSKLLVSNQITANSRKERRLNNSFFISMKGNTCRYSLPFTSKRTILSLYDLRGRVIQSINIGKQLPGQYRVSFPLPVSPGSYLISLRVDGNHINRHVVVSR